jgi:hypothetical protein
MTNEPISLRLSDSQIEVIKEAAARSNMSISTYVSQVLTMAAEVENTEIFARASLKAQCLRLADGNEDNAAQIEKRLVSLAVTEYLQDSFDTQKAQPSNVKPATGAMRTLSIRLPQWVARWSKTCALQRHTELSKFVRDTLAGMATSYSPHLRAVGIQQAKEDYARMRGDC